MCSRASAALLVLAACGGGGSKSPGGGGATLPPAPTTTAERILGLLPAGPQIVIELDLERLRANPVVGPTITRALERGNLELPAGVPASPLTTATLVVMAAYGVGTAQAATISVLAAPAPIPDATRVADGLYAVGPADWVSQLEQRATITADAPPSAPVEWLALRDRAMPSQAPGATLRITAQLSFDARVALARQVGLENAPAAVSLWGDVVDDLAIVIDADSADPGEPATKAAAARLEATILGALSSIAAMPEVRALGLPASLGGAKLALRGSWIRTIIAVGPAHLKRVVDRARNLLEPETPAP